jgi:polyhydroxyalkanoate synthesis regulator phasin
MYARYKSHDDATLSNMEDALHRFHTFIDIFLLVWAGKMAKAKANALSTELLKKRKVDKKTNAGTWTPSKMQRKMNAWHDYISHELDVCKELDADCDVPKIHLMSHWVQQIRRYGALQQHSAETHEQAHTTNLKDGWNSSNHNLNYLPQVITFQRRILCFEIRELNLQALAQRRENIAAACNVFPSGADLASPLGSQSYAKPECTEP